MPPHEGNGSDHRVACGHRGSSPTTRIGIAKAVAAFAQSARIVGSVTAGTRTPGTSRCGRLPSAAGSPSAIAEIALPRRSGAPYMRLRIIARIHKRVGECLRRARRDSDIHALRSPMPRLLPTPALLLVTPYLARREQRQLAHGRALGALPARSTRRGRGFSALGRTTPTDALIALHARRSSDSVAGLRTPHPAGRSCWC